MAAILDRNGLVDRTDLTRLEVVRRLDSTSRAAMGQFFTPAATARFMADLSEAKAGEVRLLDPGAGIGSCQPPGLPTSVDWQQASSEADIQVG